MGTRVRGLIASWSLRTWYAPLCKSHAGPLTPLLFFASRLYEVGLKIDQNRAKLRRRSLPVFVISVGNLVAGGTGKTPCALWLVGYLSGKKRRPAILSRGYGRSGGEVGRVASAGETLPLARLFGDEPALMARKAASVPVFVGRDRYTSGRLAIETFAADVLILDDGFQHLSLERNLDIVLLDAANPFGNGALLPLGPLREPVGHLKRADAIVLTRADDTEKVQETRSIVEAAFPEKPVFSCRHRLLGLRQGLSGVRIPFGALQDRPAVAFAGIARPEAFFRSLRRSGADLCRCFGFPDHHRYGKDDIARLMQCVKDNRASFLVTTEKDFVRLPSFMQSITLTAELDLDFGPDDNALRRYLDLALGCH